MRFVYATRPMPKLEFGTASQRDAIPADAEVFAVCDGALTIRQHHEQSFSTLTNQEHAALEALIVESQVSEANARIADRNGFVRRLWRRLMKAK